MNDRIRRFSLEDVVKNHEESDSEGTEATDKTNFLQGVQRALTRTEHLK